MNADIILDASLNGTADGWNQLCHISSITSSPTYQQYLSDFGLLSFDKNKLGYTKCNGRSILSYAGRVGELFGNDHSWSHERARSAGQPRPNGFIVHYVLPDTSGKFPDIEEVIDHARTDATRLIERAYRQISEGQHGDGRSILVGRESRSFSERTRPLPPIWAEAERAHLSRRPITPFAIAGDEVVRFEAVPQASSGTRFLEKNFTQTQSGSKDDYWHNGRSGGGFVWGSGVENSEHSESARTGFSIILKFVQRISRGVLPIERRAQDVRSTQTFMRLERGELERLSREELIELILQMQQRM